MLNGMFSNYSLWEKTKPFNKSVSGFCMPKKDLMLMKFNFMNSQIVSGVNLFGLTPSSITSAGNSPVMGFGDWLVWFLIMLLMIILLNNRKWNVFPIIGSWFNKGWNLLKKTMGYIPITLTALLPLGHRLFGHSTLKGWLLDIISYCFSRLSQTSNNLLYYGSIAIGITFVGLVIIKMVLHYGLLEPVFNFINWWYGQPELELPPVHQEVEQLPRLNISSSSSEENQALILQWRHLMALAEGDNSPILPGMEQIHQGAESIVSVLLEQDSNLLEPVQGPLQEGQSGPILPTSHTINKDLKMSVLTCAAIMLSAGLLKNMS